MMTDSMRLAMIDEVRQFFMNVVRDNQSIAALIDSDYTFMNAELATLYGLEESVAGKAMRRVSLADKNRGGILGMPGVLPRLRFRTGPVQ